MTWSAIRCACRLRYRFRSALLLSVGLTNEEVPIQSGGWFGNNVATAEDCVNPVFQLP